MNFLDFFSKKMTYDNNIEALKKELNDNKDFLNDWEHAYNIDCTGDVCCGDTVFFIKDIWGGSYRKPKWEGLELLGGAKVIKDSYGVDKQQHTFTLQFGSGEKMLIKGRNLYRYGTLRKKWDNEDERKKIVEEKHLRGNKARKARQYRIDNKFNLEDY